MSVRKIVFSHRRALGDALMFSAGIRDFKLLFPEIEINVDSNMSSIWENNPYINRSLKKDDPDVEYYKVGYPMVGNANHTAMHFTSMFIFDMIAVTDTIKDLPISLGEFCSIFANGRVGDPPLWDPKDAPNGPPEFETLRKKYGGKSFDPNCLYPKGICKTFIRQRGDIHLSDKEKSYNLIKDIYGIEKYWVVAPGGKRDGTTKIWDWRQFQKVVDHFEGKIQFVTIGKSDLLVERNLKGVIDLVDKFNTDVRGLFPLVYHAEGCISGPSFLNHLAAATPPRKNKERKPCVTIVGGREPSGWIHYTNHQTLHTNGAFTCCDNGGCWKARVHPLPKDPKHNNSLCLHPVTINGKQIPECMNSITPEDVIRAVEKYYDGNIYKYMKSRKDRSIKKAIEKHKKELVVKTNGKEINLLGNLNSSGGGEQSLCKIADMLQKDRWKVNLYPWSTVHDNYKKLGLNIKPHSFENGMYENMDEGLPLLFYGNDCIWDFSKQAENVVSKSSSLIIGINFANGSLPKCNWLSKSGKLKTVIFQNTEKKNEWIRDEVGFENTKKIVLYGAIELDKFYETCTKPRGNKEPLVILKHGKPDYRKYVTKESEGSGEKIHIWQKNIIKETDVKFYGRLLKDTNNTRFEFMEAHKELIKAYKNEPRMVFHKWNTINVEEFLSKGHVYLYRCSNAWRDQYPRTVAEALSVGLPCLVEPRDGPKDRIDHGNTGLYCIDYDAFLYSIKLLQRKENYRQKMGMEAKDRAKKNLDPTKWIDIINETFKEE